MGVGQSTVSRWVKEAQSRGLVKIQIISPSSDREQTELRRFLGSRVKDVQVVAKELIDSEPREITSDGARPRHQESFF